MSKAKFKTIEDDEALIPLKAGASLLGLNPGTIRQGKAGTEHLTKISQGRKIFLVKGEVLEHRKRLIEAARRAREILKESCSAS